MMRINDPPCCKYVIPLQCVCRRKALLSQPILLGEPFRLLQCHAENGARAEVATDGTIVERNGGIPRGRDAEESSASGDDGKQRTATIIEFARFAFDSGEFAFWQ